MTQDDVDNAAHVVCLWRGSFGLSSNAETLLWTFPLSRPSSRLEFTYYVPFVEMYCTQRGVADQ